MTVYISPLNLEHSTGIQSDFRLDLEDIQLFISKSPQSNGIYDLVRKYDLSQLLTSQTTKQQQNFIGYASYLWLKMQLKSKINKSQNYGQAKLNLAQLLQASCYGKNDILIKNLQIGDYKLGYQFKYNRFLQVCGNTVHKSLSVYAKPIHDGHNLKPLQTATFKDMQFNEKSHPKEVAKANGHINLSQASELPLIQNQKEQILAKPNREVVFYKGPCESNNLFSFMDGNAQVRKEKKFELIEQSYI